MVQSYELKIISVSGIHWKPNLIHDSPNLYVVIDIDGKRVHQTNPSRNWVAMWNQICGLSVDSPSSLIALQVFHKSTVGKNKCLAKANIGITHLLEKCRLNEGQKDFSVVLNHVEKNATGMEGPTLVVRMTSIGHIQAGEVALANATQDIVPLEGVGARSAVVKIVGVGVERSDLLSGLETVLSRVNIVLRIGAEVAKMHPYSNVAWKVLSSVYEAAKKQEETDEKVVKLVQTIADVYSFAEDIESLSEKIMRFEKIISALVKQTEECALFIREYTGHGFCGRLLTNIDSEYSDKIEHFVTAFVKLGEYLDRGTAVQIMFVSTKALTVVEEVVRTQKLDNLRPVDMNASMRTVCLPGTRQDILNLISNWLTTPPDAGNPGNILWLSGVAGAGKSTIATSVSQYFRGLDRLAAFLFFNRDDKVRSHPASVIRTIAFCLARSNSHVASAICAAMDHDPALVDSPIQTQFQNLLLDPLAASQSHIRGPIVVIMDALDECGDAESRRSLVSLISNDFPKLPPAVRFFITSRADSDIASKFEMQPKITKLLLDITMPSSTTDIRLYLDNEMVEIRQQHACWNLTPTWPGDSKIEALAAHSSGLFIWASTATKFLLKAHDPNRTLEIMLRKGLNLDGLYDVALRNSGPWDDTEFPDDAGAFIQDARAALSAVVLGKAPMSDATIDALLGWAPERSSSHIFSKLGCVLQWAPGQLVRILHASFSDYMTDRDRSGKRPWFIDASVLEPQLVRGCLRVLKRGLRFNICGLDDSRIRTTEVPDLSDRITTRIPPHLLYSSLFWASHLAVTVSDTHRLPNDLLADLKELMYSKFLFWLEVLCVRRQTGIAVDALEAVAKLARNGRDEALADFATDAVKFVIAFAPVIAHSVPHIYLSALPLAPTESKVAKLFSSLLVRTVGIQSSVSGQWPRLQATIEGHSSTVRSVAFSPDGRYIASGSKDTTLRVWDARTGDLIVGPFIGHSGEVNCVAFSRDGEHIVSGSHDKTVRVWDARTGTTVGVPLKGHEDTVYSVSFSPDGGRIVSGSRDQTVRIWRAHGEGNVAGFIINHAASVPAVAFSPDGDQIVSGSDDTMVRVWDARTGVLASGPLKGHTAKIRSVAFSPDGKRIASASSDAVRVWDPRIGTVIIAVTVAGLPEAHSVAFTPDGERIVAAYKDAMLRIWDAQTGALVGAPLDGHNYAIVSISVSSDGMRIASGAMDSTIRVWDAHQEPSGVHVSEEDSQCIGANDQGHPGCTGHDQAVNCVAFSPKGDRIASGSQDRTVCVWDALTGIIVTGPLHGHRGEVVSVAFSADGERLVSGSTDTTVRIWNARTGTMVAGPFEKHSDWVWSVAFSPKGDRIVSGSGDSTICVWEVATGALVIRLFDTHTMPVTSVAFSPDGGSKQIASVSAGTALVSDAQTGALVAGPFRVAGEVSSAYSVAFTPDGQLIVSGADDAVVWVRELKTEVPTLLQGHTDGVSSTSLSGDGKWIASGSWDTTVRVWDAKVGVLVAGPFEGHRSLVRSIAFSPDCRRVVSGSWDASIRVFETTPDRALKQALGDGSIRKDGWILNSMSQPMLWIPPWLHRGLYFPQNSLVIFRHGTTKLDFSRFVDGTAWEECMDPRVHSN